MSHEIVTEKNRTTFMINPFQCFPILFIACKLSHNLLWASKFFLINNPNVYLCFLASEILFLKKINNILISWNVVDLNACC